MIDKLFKFCTSCVQTVSVEGSMKQGKKGLDDEENMTDVKERETNEERQTRLVNLCHHLHISVMALHINWLGEERMIELDVQSSRKGQGRESLQSPLILLYSVVAVVIIYVITHTDYTQYVNTCNCCQARPPQCL